VRCQYKRTCGSSGADSAAFVVVVVVVRCHRQLAGRLLCSLRASLLALMFVFGDHDRHLILWPTSASCQPLSRSRRLREFLCLLLPPQACSFPPQLSSVPPPHVSRFDCIGLLLLIPADLRWWLPCSYTSVECAINALVSQLRTGEAMSFPYNMVMCFVGSVGR